ncbi:MAG: nucleotidyltransferase family protein, partial [Planctomycetota bacterium]
MDRAAAELLLASLFVESTPERLEALKNALANTKDFGGFVPALAHHGVVLLFQRNLAAAGIEPPPTLAQQLTARAGEERHVALRARLTLQRFLAAAGREHVEVTAVRSSALALDLYPEPMRTQRELELFVPPEQLTRALAAARSAGLAPDAGELPPWWTRATHGELRLRGSSAHLAPVRLSTRLHHPSLMVSAREPELLARRRRIKIEGHELFVLEPLDALLELALTLATRAGLDTLTTGRRHLLTAASSASSPLRLAELCDLRTFLERPDVTLSAGALVARAHEWNAEAALRAALECVL